MSKIDFTQARPTRDPAQSEAAEAARIYLSDTDWYVIRAMDTGVPVPEEIATARAEARHVLSDTV